MTQGVYQIKIRGQLDSNRSEWFAGWTITPMDDGITVLTGLVVDQSALHGIFVKIRNLNLPILSVNCIASEMGHLTLGACAVTLRKLPNIPFINCINPLCSLRSVSV